MLLCSFSTLRTCVAFVVGCLLFVPATRTFAAAAGSVPLAEGDWVKLTRGETFEANGKRLFTALKGHEFLVLKHDAVRKSLLVAYVTEDTSVMSLPLPADAVEALAPDPWADLMAGAEAFRNERLDDARRLLERAATSPEHQALANALKGRIEPIRAAAAAAVRNPAARNAFLQTVRNVRDASGQLAKLGFFNLALAMDDGATRLGGRVLGLTSASLLPPTVLNRAEIEPKAKVAHLAWLRYRQAASKKRMLEASKYVAEGLGAEPARPDFKAAQIRIEKAMQEAEDRCTAARSMKNRGDKGPIHALTAIEQGLKVCADHPKLLALKTEMQSTFDERTAPLVDATFLAAVGGGDAKAFENARKLYTTRCTECHELELLDSRSLTGWQRTVAGMARRASLSNTDEGRIVDYLTAALKVIDAADR